MAKTNIITEQTEEAAAPTTDELLRQVLAEVQAVKQQAAQDKAAYEQELATVRAAAQRAANPLEPDVLPPGARISGDRPATVKEKLDILERRAKEKGLEFDRERTYKVLTNQRVETLDFRCDNCGMGFDSNDQLVIHADRHATEILRSAGKR